MKTIITAYRDPGYIDPAPGTAPSWHTVHLEAGKGPIVLAFNPETQVLKIDGHHISQVVRGVLNFSVAMVRGGERG
jgi:hypothetical protein